jgi:hypothetical protein
MALFRAATKITIGNGELTSFWFDSWSDRGPLSLWPPDLFKVATRKSRSVAKEFLDDNWIRSIASLTTPVQLTQFLEVWNVVASTHLNPDMTDTIAWSPSPQGSYSAGSAYHLQFLGSFPKFDAAKIWLAHAEPKCKIFAWLALHAKLLTADKLAIRGWPHDPVCPLCLSAHETTSHLCKDCPFTTAIWNTIHHDVDDNHATHGTSFMSINDWWDNIIEGKSVAIRRNLSGRFLYVIWNAWKERNRRIFTGHRLTYIEVAAIVKEDIAQRQRAFAPARVTIPAEPD